MKIRPIVGCMVLIGLCVGLCGAKAQVRRKPAEVKKQPKAVEAVYTQSRNVTYGFTLQNTTNQVVKDLEFWTYAPVSLTATQRCERIQTSHPCTVSKDELGNQVLHFRLGDIAPEATKIIRVWAYLKVTDKEQPLRVADLAPYLSCQPTIESGSPAIMQQAKQLWAASPGEAAKRIYTWTANTIRYTGYHPIDRGAVFALQNREGDCTEFAELFVALCRANKIPARCVGGYVYQGDAALEPGRYHDWAEFYQQGTWRIADPQGKVFLRNQADFIALRVFGCPAGKQAMDFHRYRCSGVGITVGMSG